MTMSILIAFGLATVGVVFIGYFLSDQYKMDNMESELMDEKEFDKIFNNMGNDEIEFGVFCDTMDMIENDDFDIYREDWNLVRNSMNKDTFNLYYDLYSRRERDQLVG